MSLAEAIRERIDYAQGKITSWSFTKEYINRSEVSHEILVKLNSGKTHAKSTESHISWYEQDNEGKIFKWIEVRGVICPNLEKWSGKVPKMSDRRQGVPVIQGYWIRQTECRKCEFYKTRKQSSLKFPTCDWAKKDRCGDESPSVVARKNLKKDVLEVMKLIS